MPVGDAAREAILTAYPSMVMAPAEKLDDSTKLVVKAVLALSELENDVLSIVAQVVLVNQALFAQAALVVKGALRGYLKDQTINPLQSGRGAPKTLGNLFQ